MDTLITKRISSPCITSNFCFAVGEVAYVELFTDEHEKPRGCGIIEFENSVLAKKAIEKMHRHELSGRKIVVKEVGVNVTSLKLSGTLIFGKEKNSRCLKFYSLFLLKRESKMLLLLLLGLRRRARQDW